MSSGIRTSKDGPVVVKKSTSEDIEKQDSPQSEIETENTEQTKED